MKVKGIDNRIDLHSWL